ncbi:MAG: FGGY-family carbohydrate kinase [Anaerolineae bacterium]
MDLFLGLDVGTTATKALLFDLEGNVIASAGHNYDLITSHEGWVEQDPEDLWRGVVKTSRQVLAKTSPGDRVLALGLSSQGGTTIATDAQGRPLFNAISWMDQRGKAQAERVRADLGANLVYQTSGWKLQNGLPLVHILWLREHEPQTFVAAHKFLFVSDFVTYRLTGRYCTDPSSASITQLYNVKTGDWDWQLLEMADIERERLSPVKPSGVPVGTLTSAASKETGLPRGVVVVNGAHDQYCAALGAGVLRPGEMLLSCGTAWVILGVLERLIMDIDERLAISRHVIEGRWGGMVSMGGVGTVLEWYLDNILRRAEVGRSHLYRLFNEEASQSPPGANGLLFFPLVGGHVTWLGGEGALLHLSLTHSRCDMARALMEGIAYELRWVIEEMRDKGVEANELKMVGGAAKSPIWPQIVADVTGMQVILPTTKDAASRGAAILAGVGCGVFNHPEQGFAAFRTQELHLPPDRESTATYDESFGIYRQGYERLWGVHRGHQ